MEPEDDASCRWWQVSCRMGEFGTSLVGDAVENLAAAVLEGVATIVGVMATSWIFVGTPDLTSEDDIEGGIVDGEPVGFGQSHGSSSHLETLLGYAAWISLGVCVLALIFLGATMALQQRRGEGAGHISRIGLVLFATVLISGASGIVTGVLPSTGPADSSRPVTFLQSHLWWYMGAAALMSVLVGAVRMVWEQRADPGKDLMKSLMTLVVVAGAGVAIIGAAVHAADGFAAWIIDESTDVEFGDAIVTMLYIDLTDNHGIGAFLAMFVGIFIIFFSCLQIILMLVRIGMIVILAGVFPLASSFTNTEMGKTWFNKCLGWLIAFILYKPAAAIIYAAAFQLVGSSIFHEDDATGMLNILVGVTMMLISLIAMPALMKFVAPMASLGGGGVGGAMAGVAGLVGGKLASGAMKLGQDQSDSATSEAPEANGPTGSNTTGPSGTGPEQSSGAAESESTDEGSGEGSGDEGSSSTTPTGSGSQGGETGGTEQQAAQGSEAAGSTAGSAAGGAATGGTLQVAEQVAEAGEGFADDASGAVSDATKS